MLEYTARITSTDTPRVGGRNLIIKGDEEKGTIGRYVAYYLHTPIDKAEPFTLSFDVLSVDRPPVKGEFLVIFMYKTRFQTNVYIKYEEGRVRYSCIIDTQDRESYDKGFQANVVYIYPNEGFYNPDKTPNAGGFTIANIKLERGTVATDWTPSPEDLDDRISTVNTSLVSLASTLLDPNEGDIHQLFRQQDQLANSVKDKADKLELANSVSSLQGEIDKRALGLHLDNAFAYIENIVKEIDSSRSYTISDSGYISSSVHNSCRYVSKEVTPSSTVCRTPNTQPQIRLTLRSDHDALKRQVNSLTAQLAQLQATTKITPVLNTDTRKRSGSTTLYPQYGDWLLTSDSQEQYISFSGLSAEIGRSIYIQTRRKAYLYANNQSFYGLPGTSSSVAVNQWLANNTTYRFLRADATTWLVTSSASPYPWT